MQKLDKVYQHSHSTDIHLDIMSLVRLIWTTSGRTCSKCFFLFESIIQSLFVFNHMFVLIINLISARIWTNKKFRLLYFQLLLNIYFLISEPKTSKNISTNEYSPMCTLGPSRSAKMVTFMKCYKKIFQPSVDSVFFLS